MVNDVAMGIGRINPEADFFIKELYPVNFFGTTVYITTTHVCTLIVLVTIAIIALWARHNVLKTKDSPNMVAVCVEMVISALINFVNGALGQAGKKYINYVGSLFTFILVSNISGLFGLRPPTADYGTTLAIAILSFVMIQYASIRYQKWDALKGLFQPIFVLFPVNVVSEFATPISLSLRLFGNVLAGTVIMALYYGMLPVLFRLGIPAALHAYFDLFSGVIQAYVFCMLTITFVADKRNVEA